MKLLNLAKQPILLRPKDANAAGLIVFWTNRCGRAPGPLRIRVTLAAGAGTLTGPFDGPPDAAMVPQCLQPGHPSTLQILADYASGSN